MAFSLKATIVLMLVLLGRYFILGHNLSNQTVFITLCCIKYLLCSIYGKSEKCPIFFPLKSSLANCSSTSFIWIFRLLADEVRME